MIEAQPQGPAFTDLPDLAAERVGGATILANDDFFAEKENLLRQHEAEWREGAYTDRGKWMDGWETRRRREPGHDWCVVRLGMPGRIHGVVVDTKWFRGNFPESCSVEACAIDDTLDLAALGAAAWVELVPQAKLTGDSRNCFSVSDPRRFTHVRLNIFPDGGVARLRVHGEPVADWDALRALGGPMDLAALENGAAALAASDMFFGSRHNLIRPGRAANMSDGWETRRRRGPGHDWVVVRLAAEGTLERVEIDTTHFKGNAPGRVTLEAARAPGVGADVEGWRPVLESKAQPHTRHFFSDALRRVGTVTHLRLSVHPCGGVARLRAWGTPVAAPDAALARLNDLAVEDARAAFHAVCGSARFAEGLAACRPFEDRSSLLRSAERLWFSLTEADHLEAFAAHPRIGEQSAKKWSAGEQAGAAAADAATLERIARGNAAYAEKFGFLFIVCATGKTAAELAERLEARLASSRGDELRTAAEEQAQIIRLRLGKWLKEHA